MMQVEPFQPSWPNYNTTDLPIEELGLYFADMDAQMGSFEFSSPSISIDGSSDVFSSIPLSSTVYADESSSFPLYGNNDTLNDRLTVDEVEDLCEWMVSESNLSSPLLHVEDGRSLNLSPMSSEASMHVPLLHVEDVMRSLDQSPMSSEASMDVPSTEPSLVLPRADMEVDNQLGICHLLKAYGEAMEMEQKELAEEIIKRLKDKACPTGAALERLAYYLIQALDKQVDCLRQESSKNYEAAFKAFYQIFPYGRFAHFTANSVILEAVPEDAEIVHIVDFDIGKGIQWPPFIEALARRGQRVVRLTSIKFGEEDCSFVSPMQSFEETKMLLHEYARSFGLRLKMEEMDVEGLVMEMKKTKKGGGGSEWLAFNCMVGLPHMGRGKNISHAIEFLKVAKDSINHPMKNRGIITFGDGSGVFNGMSDYSGFGSFFEGQLIQFQALLESMEWHFPHHLGEARMAMECLFVAPYVSSLADLQKWEGPINEGRDLPETGLEAWRMSSDNFAEAKELVREGESLYWLRSYGENENQMVLGYMGVPLVTVSSWR